ncbi:MAG: hypothetical protein EA397_20405 [Deltaproteobacteria bacterium]|nr:MAG: hypothetical protein EA397_20405 [Deltaproteobacteria bacterium]
MPFEADVAAEALAAEVPGCPQVPPQGWPIGAPPRDLMRSPVAARIGALAAAEGLRLFHYEHRHHLALSQDFVPEHAAGLAEPPRFEGGVLPERKYQSFRHDQAIGGFHPGMRSKWTAHELCHALVGFAWHPDPSPLFLATAGRLAELLPVALWYFLDEAHLRRCPLHRASGPLYRGLCLDCEAVSEARVDDLHAAAVLDDGRLFLERELQAIRRTRALGLPVPSIHGSLDLCSDGLAYAAAHGPRLRSPIFARFAEGFLVEGGGWVRDLDALEARVLAVLDALVGEAELPRLAPTAAHGECRWVLQDLAWRLLSIRQDCEGEAADALDGTVDMLSAVCALTAQASVSPLTVQERSKRVVHGALHLYRDLYESFVLPEPDHVFALGHDLLGVHPGRSIDQVREGIVSALPITARVLGERLPELVELFVAQDPPVRALIGRRFATWLLGHAEGPLVDLARFEAEVTHLGARDEVMTALGDFEPHVPVRLTPGVVILRAEVDVMELTAAADFGDIEVQPDLSLRDVDGEPIPREPTSVGMIRGLDGSVEVTPLEPEVAGALLRLSEGAVLDLPAQDRQLLASRGLIRPVRYPI